MISTLSPAHFLRNFRVICDGLTDWQANWLHNAVVTLAVFLCGVSVVDDHLKGFFILPALRTERRRLGWHRERMKTKGGERRADECD